MRARLASAAGSARTAAFDQMSECVGDLAYAVRGGCLVEGAAGKLVAHSVSGQDVAPFVIDALLSGEVSSVHRGMSARRTTGLLTCGPVIEGVVGAVRVAYIAFAHLGGVWLLPQDDGPLDLSQIHEPLQRLANLLALDGSDVARSTLAACLEGDAVALPDALAGTPRCWVAAVHGLERVDGLLTKLGHAGLVAQTARCGRRGYVVVGTQRDLPDAKLLAELSAWIDTVAAVVTIGLSEACPPRDLAVARRQADLALSAAEPGSCARLSEVRSRLVVRELVQSVSDLDRFGPDPLQRLVDHDTAKGSELVPSIRAWLDTFGDTTLAAQSLGVHPNTLRYRLRRAGELLQIDLARDTHARVEIHARLLVSEG